MATVLILGVSVQNIYAAPEKPAVIASTWIEPWQGKFIQKIVDFTKIFHGKSQQVQEIKDHGITFVVKQITSKETPAPETAVKAAENTAAADKGSGVSGSGSEKGASSPASQIRSEDLELLARIIYAEARGESFQGQVAVGAVILNRLEHPAFPKTIREIIYAPGQFTAVTDRQIELKPDDKAYQAAAVALEGSDPTNGAIFYYNPKLSKDKWMRSRSVVSTIGNHTFCV